MWRVAVIALVACGRFGFDGGAATEVGDADVSDSSGSIDASSDSSGSADAPSACANPAGHDEDLDGLDDACDPCPHLAAVQADGDGDGVGDDCDPSAAPHQIAFFDPFTGPRAEWPDDAATMVFANDQLLAGSLTMQRAFQLAIVPARDTVVFAGDTTREGPLDHQVAFGVEAADGIYYCQVWEGSGGPLFSLTYNVTGSGEYPAIEWQPVQGAFANQAFQITLILTAPTASCTTTWPGTDEMNGTVPAQVGAPLRFFLGVSRLDTRFDYLLLIRES